MNKVMESVALSIYAQTVHGNITVKQADKLIATIITAWKVRDIPFDVQVFRNTALIGSNVIPADKTQVLKQAKQLLMTDTTLNSTQLAQAINGGYQKDYQGYSRILLIINELINEGKL